MSATTPNTQASTPAPDTIQRLQANVPPAFAMLAGMQLEVFTHLAGGPRDVADLIGDTEQMVLKHYARWVPERQERLTNILRDKLSTAPKPTLAVVGGKNSKTTG